MKDVDILGATRTGVVVVGVFLCALSERALSSEFSVDSWSLNAYVRGNSDQFGSYFQTVMNPFVADSGQLTDRASTSSVSFDFWWNDQYGSFLIEGSQHCVAQNLPPFPGAIGREDCADAGGIHFTANADLLLSVDAAYPYHLDGPELFAQLLFEVTQVSNDPVDPLFSAVRRDDTFINYPASGTFVIQGQAIIPAGQTYILSYDRGISAWADSGAIADGSGYIHFTLQSVPEPAVLGLLALGGAMIRRRRPC